MTTRSLIGGFIMGLALLACDGGGSEKASQCHEAFERELDLRLERLGDQPPDVLEAHRDNLVATRARYVEHCESAWAEERRRCAREADDLSTLRDCDQE